MFFSENGLNHMAFGSLQRFEAEVVRMAAGLLNGGPGAVGCMTSGGTESCMLAVKTYRDRALARRRPCDPRGDDAGEGERGAATEAGEVMAAALQLLLVFVFPALALWGERKTKIVAAISPVILCYSVGMLLGNLPFVPLNTTLATTTCEVLVALAIPLLLFSVDLGAWARLAGRTVLSFVLVMVAAVAGSVGAWALVGRGLDHGPEMAGMLAGVYTGGTPNMAAIGTGLGVLNEAFVLLNAADMVASIPYLFLVLLVAPRVLARLLPPFRRGHGEIAEPMLLFRSLPRPAATATALLLTGAVVGAGVGIGALLPEGGRSAGVILVITTLAVGLSAVQRVRSLRGTHDMGQYLLLAFCVSIGTVTDFSEVFSSNPIIVLLAILTVIFSVSIHFALAVMFRIDRDTAIITSAETRTDVLRDSFRTVVGELQVAQGDDPRAWTWGALHTFYVRHPFGRKKALRRLNLPRYPAGGGWDSIWKAHFALSDHEDPFRTESGPVYRQVIDLSDIHHAHWILDTGASGWPDSPHYRDQYELWRKGEYVPMTSDWGLITNQAEAILTLE